MNERPRAVMAVYLILERDGKILLLLRKNVSYMSGFWCMPSGHVEQGELITDALIRETEEEVRIKVRRKDLRLLHTMFRAKHDETGERVDFFFTADSFEGEPQNGEPAKCAEVRWFPKDALPKNIVPNQLLAIKSIWNGIPFSEYPSNFFPAK